MEGNRNPSHHPVQVGVVREGQGRNSERYAQELVVEFAVADQKSHSRQKQEDRNELQCPCQSKCDNYRDQISNML